MSIRFEPNEPNSFLKMPPQQEEAQEQEQQQPQQEDE